MSKRIFVLLLCLTMILCLAACGNNEGDRIFSSEYVNLEIIDDCGLAGVVLVETYF